MFQHWMWKPISVLLNRMDFIDFVLSVYRKDPSNVVALVGDKNATKTALAGIMGCDFVGCGSNGFNLAM